MDRLPLRAPAHRRSERGLAVVMIAILALVILGFVGLAVDSGHVYTTAQQLQAAADSAALAGAAKVEAEAATGATGGTYPDTRKACVDAAASNTAAGEDVILTSNSGNSAGGDIVVGKWNESTQTFTPTLVAPNAVKAVARRTSTSAGGALSYIFGGFFGVSEGDVSRYAIASHVPTPNPLIHVLDPSANGAMTLGGSADLDIGAGRVQVNSSASCGIKVGGSAGLSAEKTTVHGGACAGSGAIQGELEQYGSIVPDPLADMLPTTSDWNALKSSMPKPLGGSGKVSIACVLVPGYYPKGLDITNSMVVQLLPGSYMFGTEFTMHGTSIVTAGAGVTLFFDQNTEMYVGGGASVILVPPLTGPFQGLSVMFHRGTTSSNACQLIGNGTISIQGTLYCPSGHVDIGGTGATQLYGQLVVDQLDVSGNGSMTGLAIVPPDSSGTISLVH